MAKEKLIKLEQQEQEFVSHYAELVIKEFLLFKWCLSQDGRKRKEELICELRQLGKQALRLMQRR